MHRRAIISLLALALLFSGACDACKSPRKGRRLLKGKQAKGVESGSLQSRRAQRAIKPFTPRKPVAKNDPTTHVMRELYRGTLIIRQRLMGGNDVKHLTRRLTMTGRQLPEGGQRGGEYAVMRQKMFDAMGLLEKSPSKESYKIYIDSCIACHQVHHKKSVRLLEKIQTLEPPARTPIKR